MLPLDEGTSLHAGFLLCFKYVFLFLEGKDSKTH